MMGARRWPLFAAVVRSRWRAAPISMGLMPFLVLPVALGISSYVWWNTPLTETSPISGLASGLYLFSQCWLLLAVPLMVWRATGRERQRLAMIRLSAVSSHQIVAALVFGSVWIEWLAVAVLWSALGVGSFLVPELCDVGTHSVYTLMGIFASLTVALLCLHLQAPRPLALFGHVFLIGIYLIFILLMEVIAIIGTQASIEQPTVNLRFLAGFLFVIGAAAVQAWNRSGQLIQMRPPSRWALVARFLTPVVPLVPTIGSDPQSRGELFVLVPAIMLLALAALTTTWWDNLAHPQLRLSIRRICMRASGGLLLALVLLAVMQRAEIGRLGVGGWLQVGLIVAAAMMRLVLYSALLQWVSNRFPVLQSIAVWTLLIVVELTGLCIAAISNSFVWQCIARMCSTVIDWNSLQTQSRLSVHFELWTGCLPPLLTLMLGNAVLSAAWLAGRRGRPTSLKRQPLFVYVPKSQQTGVLSVIDRWLTYLSPLIPTLLRQQVRRFRLTTALQLAAMLIALVVVVLSICMSRFRDASGLVGFLGGSGRVLTCVEVFVLAAVTSDLQTTLRRDRDSGRLRNHLLSSMSVSRVACGYWLGSGLISVVPAVAFFSLVLIFGAVTGTIGAVIVEQMLLLLLFTVAYGLIAFILSHPLSNPQRMRPLLLVLSATGIGLLGLLLSIWLLFVEPNPADPMGTVRWIDQPPAASQTVGSVMHVVLGLWATNTAGDANSPEALSVFLPFILAFASATAGLLGFCIFRHRLHWIEGSPAFFRDLVALPTIVSLAGLMVPVGVLALPCAMSICYVAMLCVSPRWNSHVHLYTSSYRASNWTVAIALAMIAVLGALRLPWAADNWPVVFVAIVLVVVAAFVRLRAYVSLTGLGERYTPRMSNVLLVSVFLATELGVPLFTTQLPFPIALPNSTVIRCDTSVLIAGASSTLTLIWAPSVCALQGLSGNGQSSWSNLSIDVLALWMCHITASMTVIGVDCWRRSARSVRGA